jgi:hypothetical protein
MPLFSMFLLRGGNLQDHALPDFLGIHEINPVLAEVFQALLFVPFKPYICILSVYDTYIGPRGKGWIGENRRQSLYGGSGGGSTRGKHVFIFRGLRSHTFALQDERE